MTRLGILGITTAALALFIFAGCQLGNYDPKVAGSHGADATSGPGGGTADAAGGKPAPDAPAGMNPADAPPAVADAHPGAPDARPPEPDAQPAPPDAQPVTCDNPVNTNNSGVHNAGRSCLNCHDGFNAPQFTLAGTIYADTSGFSPAVGVTIHVTDANGQQLTLVSALNGNFYTGASLAFPVHVTASSCPDTVKMVSAVNSSGGSCNASGCHDSSFPIHIP